uniref:interferon regulatory factor 3-like isoform X2 n=1 Tax=Pristiophorus japonicus TaxID=55135 RepID=UPI00398E9D76
MASQKPLLCPWLVEQINSSRYPGLCWLNPERTRFRIPWKHGLRQNISTNDTKIFEAWAIATGRHRPGTDSPDPSIWKRNFRNALNRKKNFRRMGDNRNSSEDPHLIYEIQSGGQEPGVSSDEESVDISPATDISSVGILTLTPPNPISLETSLSDLMIRDQPSGDGEQLFLLERDLAFNHPGYSPDHALLLTDLSPVNPAPELPLEVSACGACAMPPQAEEPIAAILNVGQFQEQMRGFFPNRELETQFEVTVYYRGRKVQEHIVTNTNGFRLSYDSESSFPYLEDLRFPGVRSTLVSDLQQICYTEKLLGRVGQGLTLEVHGGAFLAQRHGSCKAFWSMSPSPDGREPQPISSKEHTVLYDLSQFKHELDAFMNTRGGSPQYSMWLCFGELWPDPDRKAWGKKLIMVQVTPVTFKLLHELAHGTGASSLQSDEVNLQFSDPLSTSSFLAILEEYMDID